MAFAATASSTQFPRSKTWGYQRHNEGVVLDLKLEPTLPLQTQKLAKQEHLYFLSRCDQYGLKTHSLKSIHFKNDAFSVRKGLLGYRVCLSAGQPRFRIGSKDVLFHKGGNKHRYAITKAYTLILLCELKHQKSPLYSQLAQSFSHLHKAKKQSIARYLNATNLFERSAKVSYFRLTGRLSSWYIKHIDPMILGFSDHRSLASWQADFAGLMAQVTEYGFEDIAKVYAGQIRKVNSVIAENNHQVSLQPIRSLLSGKRFAVIKENRKLMARREAVSNTLQQLQLISAFLKYRGEY